MVFPAASRPTVRGNNKEAKKSHFENDGVFSQLNVCKVGSQNVMRDPKIENAHKMESKQEDESAHGIRSWKFGYSEARRGHRRV